ncbi:MAG: exodeoxyribonuclease III, partial [Planctomycetota bacterium]
SQEKGVRLPYKLAFCRAMQRFLKGLEEKGYETLLVGDYNIAHQPIDLARPKNNEKNPGYLPEERQWMTTYLKAGFHDVYRELNPDQEGAYTWWTMRTNAREKNIGWRLDYTTVTSGLMDRVTDAKIHNRIDGSDHCPVSVELS